jgi:AraC family transcriptional regulator, regulatory protein of adaptative response / DNA-3-methyladenine glycosylase II
MGRGVFLQLPCTVPYNWDALVRFLMPRATPGVEQAAPDYYRRVVPGGWVEVRPDGGNPHLTAVVYGADPEIVGPRLLHVFDLAAPVRRIEKHLALSPRLSATVRRERGLRIPGAWDTFELIVRAVLGQQVTVKGATTLTGRLVERYGERSPHGPLFPRPEVLAAEDIASIGLPRARAAALRGVAEAFASSTPPASAAELKALPGIGDWTAQYVEMRAFHNPDAFPATDLGLLRAAGEDVARQAEAWRPWRAYAAMHLWMERPE